MPATKLNFQKLATEKDIQRQIHPSFWRELLGYIAYFLEIFITVAILYLFVRYFVFDVINISGSSMYPTYKDKDAVYVDLLTPRFSDYQRGEVIILVAPKDCEATQSLFIKRIVGLPGDKLIFDAGKVYIKNPELGEDPIRINEGAYLEDGVKTYKNIVSDGPRFEEETLGPNEYFTLGDNRTGSLDSRRCGKISKDIILGREFYRILPREKQGIFQLPKYNIPN